MSLNMNLMITTLVMIFISHLAYSSTIDPDPQTQSIVDTICKQTVNFKQCELIVLSQLEGPSADILTITELTTKKAQTFATETQSRIRDTFLPNATDSREKVVYSACEIAYKAVASRLDKAYKSILESDFVGMKAQHNQALRYIEICVKKSHFFPRTQIVGVNYNARLMANIASTAGHMLAPSTTSSA